MRWSNQISLFCLLLTTLSAAGTHSAHSFTKAEAQAVAAMDEPYCTMLGGTYSQTSNSCFLIFCKDKGCGTTTYPGTRFSLQLSYANATKACQDFGKAIGFEGRLGVMADQETIVAVNRISWVPKISGWIWHGASIPASSKLCGPEGGQVHFVSGQLANYSYCSGYCLGIPASPPCFGLVNIFAANGPLNGQLTFNYQSPSTQRWGTSETLSSIQREFLCEIYVPTATASSETTFADRASKHETASGVSNSKRAQPLAKGYFTMVTRLFEKLEPQFYRRHHFTSASYLYCRHNGSMNTDTLQKFREYLLTRASWGHMLANFDKMRRKFEKIMSSELVCGGKTSGSYQVLSRVPFFRCLFPLAALLVADEDELLQLVEPEKICRDMIYLFINDR